MFCKLNVKFRVNSIIIRGAGFELTTLVVIGTNYISSCKSTYNAITITHEIKKNTTDTAPFLDQFIEINSEDMLRIGFQDKRDSLN